MRIGLLRILGFFGDLVCCIQYYLYTVLKSLCVLKWIKGGRIWFLGCRGSFFPTFTGIHSATSTASTTKITRHSLQSAHTTHVS
jgi:hypothetical protein